MHQPTGAAFDVVLLLHVGCAAVGLVTTLAATATATRLKREVVRGTARTDALRRYFRPGFNWAGRVVYGVPAFGFALLAMSRGAYALSDGWVLGGLALFVGVVLVAEGVLWPAEQRLQRRLGSSDEPGGAVGEAAVGADARAMARAGTAVLVLLVAGVVLMVAQP